MDLFESMDNTQKLILGIAVATLVIAIIIYFRSQKAENAQVTPVDTAQPMSGTPQPSYPQQPPHPPRQNQPVGDGDSKVLVLFFAPWCGHCKEMAPVWSEFSKNFDGYNGVKLLKINGEEEPQLTKIHEVSGYPTIKFCSRGLQSPDGVTYQGDRSIQSLADFLQQNA